MMVIATELLSISLMIKHVYLYNPNCSNLFKRLLFFDEICSLFSKNVPWNVHGRAENCKLFNKHSFVFPREKMKAFAENKKMLKHIIRLSKGRK